MFDCLLVCVVWFGVELYLLLHVFLLLGLSIAGNFSCKGLLAQVYFGGRNEQKNICGREILIFSRDIGDDIFSSE